MLKILDNKYKIQTFFDQVAEILDKEEEDFIERIRFKSTTEFIQQMDKYILYLEQNAFRPTDLKAGRIPIPAEYLKERFAAWHRLPMRSRFQPMAEEIARELTFTYHQEPMGRIQIRQLGNELKRCSTIKTSTYTRDFMTGWENRKCSSRVKTGNWNMRM